MVFLLSFIIHILKHLMQLLKEEIEKINGRKAHFMFYVALKLNRNHTQHAGFLFFNVIYISYFSNSTKIDRF